MNAPSSSKAVPETIRVADLTGSPPANDERLAQVVRKEAPFTRCYRRFARQLRAAAAQYVARDDVDDLAQDVWAIAARQPAKLVESDKRTLSWLIGIAKRCAPGYRAGGRASRFAGRGAGAGGGG